MAVIRNLNWQRIRSPQGPSLWFLSVFSLLIANWLFGWDRLLLIGIQKNELLDKVGHALFFGMLSFLFFLSALKKTSWPTSKVAVVSFSVIVVLSAIDESSQLFSDKRNFDAWDLCANILGAAIVGPLACLIPKAAEQESVYSLSSSNTWNASSGDDRGLSLPSSSISKPPSGTKVSRICKHKPRLSRAERIRNLETAQSAHLPKK